MFKVSVIVPVYNSEKYIDRCVKSLINQTYRELQIILVDDFSTDKTKEICLKYSQLDSRISIIDSEREGVSAARNTGIRCSEGKYICFLDSDDEYELNFVEKMIENIEKEQAQLVVCGYKEVQKLEWIEKKFDFGKMDAIKCLNKYTTEFGFEHMVNYPWNKLYVSKIIKENNVFFDERITVSEDAVFNMQYLKYIDNAKIIQDTLVKHYIRKDSLVSRRVSKEVQKYTILRIYDEYKNNYVNRQQLENNIGKVGRYLMYCFLRLFEIYDGKELLSLIKESQGEEYRTIIKNADCININYRVFKTLYLLKFNKLLYYFSNLKKRN